MDKIILQTNIKYPHEIYAKCLNVVLLLFLYSTCSSIRPPWSISYLLFTVVSKKEEGVLTECCCLFTVQR